MANSSCQGSPFLGLQGFNLSLNMAPYGQGGHITFEFVAMVLLFPLGGENVEISWLLKKAEIARRDSRRKNSFKLTPARKLILRFDQNPNVIWCQDIQYGCIEVLWPRNREEEGMTENISQRQRIKS